MEASAGGGGVGIRVPAGLLDSTAVLGLAKSSSLRTFSKVGGETLWGDESSHESRFGDVGLEVRLWGRR